MKELRKKALELASKRFFVPAAKILHSVCEEAGRVGDLLESAADQDLLGDLKGAKEGFLESLVEEFCTHAFLKVPTSTALLYSNALACVPSSRPDPT